MNRMHVQDLSRSTSPWTYEGAGYQFSMKPGASMPMHIVERVADTRRRAFAAGNTKFKAFCKWRFDLYRPLMNQLDIGWDMSWLLSGGPEIFEDVVEWVEDGWTFAAPPKTDMNKYSKAIAATGGWPCFYGTPNSGEKHWRLSQFITDIRIPAYREYAINHAVQVAETFSLDGLLVDCKMGWMADGSPERDRPFSERFHGGPFTRTGYGPGEFQEAYAEMLRGLANHNIWPVLITRPALDGPDPWAWMPSDLRDLPIAEYI